MSQSPSRIPEKFPRRSERRGFQSGKRENLFQLAVGVFGAVVGAYVSFRATDDLPELAAALGGFAGLVVGVFLAGGISLLVNYPYPAFMFRIPDVEMSGLEHLRHQKERQDRAVNCLLLVVLLFGLSVCTMAVPRLLAQIIVFGWFPVFIAMLWMVRPRCPFCRCTYQFGWQGFCHGRFCRECGKEFAANSTHQRDGNEGVVK